MIYLGHTNPCTNTRQTIHQALPRSILSAEADTFFPLSISSFAFSWSFVLWSFSPPPSFSFHYPLTCSPFCCFLLSFNMLSKLLILLKSVPNEPVLVCYTRIRIGVRVWMGIFNQLEYQGLQFRLCVDLLDHYYRLLLHSPQHMLSFMKYWTP